MTNTRPTAFEQRVILQEAAGGTGHHVMAVIPSVTRVGVPFQLGLSVLDRNWLPCVGGTAAVRVDGGDFFDRSVTVAFVAGEVAACRIPGACLSKPGCYRVAVHYNGRIHYSNPTCCAVTGQRPVYWGDPHIHTILSDCLPERCRSLDLACIMARQVYYLDWITLADHVSNGRGSRGKWKAMWTAVARHDAPPHFVMLPGYEASLRGGAGGDNNVYLRDEIAAFVDHYEAGNARTLSEALAGVRHFMVPHHTSRPGKHGEIPAAVYPGPERMPLVEIHSKWGTSEFRGNPTPLRQGVHDGPCYVQDLLAQGYHLGFIGGTDTHTSLTFARGIESPHINRAPGLTAVCSRDLSRGGVFRALAARRCYAACGQRILLDVRVAGRRMGAEVRGVGSKGMRSRLIRAMCAAAEPIARLEVVRNGEVIHAERPEQWYARLEYRDKTALDDVALTGKAVPSRFVYYYVRVTLQNGDRAWSSPTRFAL